MTKTTKYSHCCPDCAADQASSVLHLWDVKRNNQVQHNRALKNVAKIIGERANALLAFEDQCEQADQKQAAAAKVLQYLATRRDSDRLKTDSRVGHSCKRCKNRYVAAKVASSCSCTQTHRGTVAAWKIARRAAVNRSFTAVLQRLSRRDASPTAELDFQSTEINLPLTDTINRA